MRIAIGSDHRGLELCSQVVSLLERLGQEVINVDGPPRDVIDYPDVAAAVARLVSSKQVDRGILVCGTGLGMCIVANKFPGVQAAPCHDEVSAEISRRHNDLNVLCLSADTAADRSTDRLVQVWLETQFEGGRHARRLQKIRDLECRNGQT